MLPVRAGGYAAAMRGPLLLAALLPAAACPPEARDSWVEPGCGNGIVEGGEACDDGAANSDTAPDACRTRCVPPACGDGVADAVEACDDGSPWGGDGCTPACTAEEGAPEQEPNDDPATAMALAGEAVSGHLEEGDRDCFAVGLAQCEALGARLVGGCPVPAVVSLHHPDGSLVAASGLDADGCAVLDPAEAAGARFVDAGDWTVCVEGVLGAEVPYYTLTLDVVAAKDAIFTLPEEDDPDGDGRPDACDDDRDGDGVADEDDDCPDVPDGPDMAPLTPTADGWLRAWLAAGPFDGRASPATCLPTEDDLVAEDDAAARPALGDPAGGHTWAVLWGRDDRVGFEERYATVHAPREVYQALHLRSDRERALTLSLGPDDGARVWLGGAEVLDVSTCQGTVMDMFTAEVTLPAGWTTLLVKVYDQGGGWGNYVRFLDAGAPVTDLEVSLSPDGPWAPGQSDLDGDGLGDVCDPTPTGG